MDQALENQEYVQKLRDDVKLFQESSEQAMCSRITGDLCNVAELSGTSTNNKLSGIIMLTVS